MAHALTPYDTGERLEPKPWVTSTQGVGDANRDDWGRVDFDNDESATVLTIVCIRDEATGGYTVAIENHFGVPIDVKVSD